MKFLWMVVMLATSLLVTACVTGSAVVEPSDLSFDGDETTLNVPGIARYNYPDGEKGWHRIGLSFVHDGSDNWRDIYGVRFEVFQSLKTELQVVATMQNAPYKLNKGSTDVTDTYTCSFGLSGKGWHTVTLPLSSFNIEHSKLFALESIKTFSIEAAFTDGGKGEIQIRNLHLVNGDVLHLDCPVRSRSAKGDKTVEYELSVENCTDKPQAVSLSQSMQGREVMETTIQPTGFILDPGEARTASISVTVSERVAPGGHEKQTILASANGRPAGQVEFKTVSYLEHPYIIHTPERWDVVRNNAENMEWAKKEAAKIIKASNDWKVPEINQTKVSKASNCIYSFGKDEVKKAWNAAIAWQLTRDMKHAEKVVLFLRRLADPETGYPKTLQASPGSLVQEGVFFQHVAWAYDTIYDSGLLTPEDDENIEKTFRLYFDVINQSISQGITGNWEVAQLCGAVYCALAIQDLAMAERFIEGAGGFLDQVSNGIMSDGWWYECAIGYNGWVTSEFTQLALAMQPWGVDYLNASFPATYSKEYSIFPVDAEKRRQYIYGKPFQKWGTIHKPNVRIQDMWNAMLPYIDYNGIMFANNDAYEKKFKNNYYEIAYFAYGDPKYASIIKSSGVRDLVYGVAELPEETPVFGEGSAYSDNVGASMLRSTQNEPRERIQAVLKYGTHGGYHGHFDRTALNSLMRYGRSFYNPEHIWYSYPNFMYAFFVQSSLPHNMVIVDMKQQEAVESHKLFFSTNEVMQVTAVETKARWSTPPYGGINYPWFTGDTFQEKCWDEGRYMPVPENEPKWGTLVNFTERVTQRRLMAVTDNYVVLADYLESPEGHTFDCMFNIKGFQGLNGGKVKKVRHTEQMNPDPLLAAQVITDCNWYEANGTTKVSFETQYGEGADNAGTRIFGEDGSLKMDVYSAWPKDREVMIGTLPEAHWVNRKFWYAIEGDGKMLAEGKFGAWILGRDEIDVDIQGLETLTLTTRAEFDERKAPKTLFWAEPVIVTAEGKELNLSDLEMKTDRIAKVPALGKDYYGGAVKIAGKPFAHSVAANPEKSGKVGTITIDLSGLNAVKFKSSVGGDYPLGDETWRRKALSFRAEGKIAQYLTVIEPFEKESVVESVVAQSANEVTVNLKDGRTQVVTIRGMEAGADFKVAIKEHNNGQLIREETHSNP